MVKVTTVDSMNLISYLNSSYVITYLIFWHDITIIWTKPLWQHRTGNFTFYLSFYASVIFRTIDAGLRWATKLDDRPKIGKLFEVEQQSIFEDAKALLRLDKEERRRGGRERGEGERRERRPLADVVAKCKGWLEICWKCDKICARLNWKLFWTEQRLSAR